MFWVNLHKRVSVVCGEKNTDLHNWLYWALWSQSLTTRTKPTAACDKTSSNILLVFKLQHHLEVICMGLQSKLLKAPSPVCSPSVEIKLIISSTGLHGTWVSASPVLSTSFTSDFIPHMPQQPGVALGLITWPGSNLSHPWGTVGLSADLP